MFIQNFISALEVHIFDKKIDFNTWLVHITYKNSYLSKCSQKKIKEYTKIFRLVHLF